MLLPCLSVRPSPSSGDETASPSIACKKYRLIFRFCDTRYFPDITVSDVDSMHRTVLRCTACKYRVESKKIEIKIGETEGRKRKPFTSGASSTKRGPRASFFRVANGKLLHDSLVMQSFFSVKYSCTTFSVLQCLRFPSPLRDFHGF